MNRVKDPQKKGKQTQSSTREFPVHVSSNKKKKKVTGVTNRGSPATTYTIQRFDLYQLTALPVRY